MKKAEQIDRRYRENLDLLPVYNDYVFHQTGKIVCSLRYGKNGWMDANGCGAVALHNVMKHIGRTQNLCDVLREMEELRMPWLGARFGTKPWSLGRYFTKHKIPYKKYKSPNDFKAALLTHRVGIVCTWNRPMSDGMHFYCVYYSKEDNMYYTANYGSAKDEFTPIPLSEISNLRFIIGYVV